MRTKKRILSTLLTVCLIVGMLPQTAFATAGAQDSGVTIGMSGICEHHTEHTEDCGYIEDVEGAVCGYACEECAAAKSEPPAATETQADAPAGECSCGTDDPAIHSTLCSAYTAPENPECFCVEKCPEDAPNEWCDICGVQDADACEGGGDEAAAYTVLPMSVFAADVAYSYNCATLYSDGTLEITADVSNLASVPWQNERTSIKKVVFTVETQLSQDLFSDCTNLAEITLPSTVTEIPRRCFNSCTSLTSITIPDSVTSIGERAFSDCQKLSSITFGVNSQLQTIGDFAFNNCDVLESIVIPDTVTSIGGNAFNSCDALANIVIPDSVTSISNGAFSSCIALASISIPDSVTSIGERAFYSCDALASITIPDTVTSIGGMAFYGCNVLTEINYKGSVEDWNSITKGDNAIPNSVKINHTGSCTDTQNDNNHSCDVCGKADVSTHTYGSATCEVSATCSECGATMGDALGHNWGNWNPNNDGTHTRTCGSDANHTETNNCSGGTATCTTPQTCTDCGYEIASATGHNYDTSVWKKDASGHWHECSCGAKTDEAVHTPGAAATEDTPQTCTICGYEIAPVLDHTHTWGDWISNGDGTHTRTCSTDRSHTEDGNCSGGTATCKDKATCSVCGTAYGSLNSSNHTGGTETRGYVAATATTAGYTGDTHCKGCGAKIGTGSIIPKTGGGGGNRPSYDDDDSDGEDTPVPPAPTTPTNQPTTTDSGGWTEIKDEIGNTPPGGTVHVDMNGATVVPGEIWNEIAGQDITVEFDMGGGLSWTVNGKDIPTGGNLSDLNLGISTTANTIPVDIINNITGERYTMQLTLSHNGEFGFRLYLNVEVGLESAGHWANLYHYNTGRGGLDFMAAARIDSAGKVALPFDHASSYAVVIDTESHAPTSPATGDTEYITYTVQRGDTLWAIAKKYGCTVSEIVAANSGLIKDPDLIYAGWQLKIPQAGATGTDNTPDAILPDDKKTGVYIVKRGDTLWAISKMYGCTVAEIVALNGELIADPDLIFAGWEIKIPQN